ncbi:MAG: TrmH family RNA methyltransferase [Planctomycetota bacterium]|jgi:tRNA G18 (ribose-2'-O)-methylase SpoU
MSGSGRKEREKLVRVRCPNPACRVEIELPPARLGKNEPCPSCAQVITVVPIALSENAAREREAAAKAASCEGSARCTMPVAVVLENIRSLWNVGSIFRTADAAGVEELWLVGITGRPPREEISKTALGAEEAVRWREAATALEAVESLREGGRFVVALERTSASVPLAGADVRFPCALLLGNEVAGLSAEAIEAADVVCHVPMHGVKSSLNVAVAAGVALYEIRGAAERAGVARPES